MKQLTNALKMLRILKFRVDSILPSSVKLGAARLFTVL